MTGLEPVMAYAPAAVTVPNANQLHHMSNELYLAVRTGLEPMTSDGMRRYSKPSELTYHENPTQKIRGYRGWKGKEVTHMPYLTAVGLKPVGYCRCSGFCYWIMREWRDSNPQSSG